MAIPGVPRGFLHRLKTREDGLAALLFGSRARGDHRPGSDVDLLVLLRKGAGRRVEVSDGFAFECAYGTEKGARTFWEANPGDAVRHRQDVRALFHRVGTGKP
ncbi:MAG: nucleotidyltransferase domain-containing protein [Planctomycetaceae bacterium]|nr:nucleotidyltransferase domain-containing protein [Planctomycetaceae bacterium]